MRPALQSSLHLALLFLALAPHALGAERESLLKLEFREAEIAKVVEAVSVATGVPFLFDATLSGQITIDITRPITAGEALEVLDAVLHMHGFATVPAPGGFRKIVPTKGSAGQAPWRAALAREKGERIVTTLISLDEVDAERVARTLDPFLPPEGVIVPYAATNSLVVAGLEGQLYRLREIAEALDAAEQRDIHVIPLRYADADSTANQLTEMFGSARARDTSVKILANARTNSLLIRATREDLERILASVARIDRPVRGEGRIQVRHLAHADSEVLAGQLQGLISGAARPAGNDRRNAASVPDLGPGVSVAAYPSTNSLVIVSDPRASAVIEALIDELDRPRAQVLVETAILEVDLQQGRELGFTGLLQIDDGNDGLTIGSATDSATGGSLGDIRDPLSPVLGLFADLTYETGDTVIRAILRASESADDFNIVSRPQLLTADNEEAEVRIGDNIPIISSRTEAAAGSGDDLSSSVNVERQDVGVTLRVTPQITVDDVVRLKLFQELTALNFSLQGQVGDLDQVGPTLRNRRVENVVLVPDGAAIVIGGIIEDATADSKSGIPWLADIPALGFLFRTDIERRRMRALLTLVTPHIVRGDVATAPVARGASHQELVDRAAELLERE